METDTVLSTEELVGNKSIRSWQSLNTHPRGLVGDKQTTKSVSKVMSSGGRCPQENRTGN